MLLQIDFEQEQSLLEFLTMTLPLYQWTEARDCRFFVRIIDKTEGHEKAVYKHELRTVGQHFYYFEDVVGGFN